MTSTTTTLYRRPFHAPKRPCLYPQLNEKAHPDVFTKMSVICEKTVESEEKPRGLSDYAGCRVGYIPFFSLRNSDFLSCHGPEARFARKLFSFAILLKFQSLNIHVPREVDGKASTAPGFV